MPAKNRAQQRAVFAKMGEKKAKAAGYDKLEGQSGKKKGHTKRGGKKKG